MHERLAKQEWLEGCVRREKKMTFNDFVRLFPLFPHSLNGPLLLAQRATIVLLHPKGHTAVMKRMVAFSPDDDAVLPAIVLLAFCLTPEARI